MQASNFIYDTHYSFTRSLVEARKTDISVFSFLSTEVIKLEHWDTLAAKGTMFVFSSGCLPLLLISSNGLFARLLYLFQLSFTKDILLVMINKKNENKGQKTTKTFKVFSTKSIVQKA